MSQAFVLNISFPSDSPLALSTKKWQPIGDGLDLPPGAYVVFVKVDTTISSTESKEHWLVNPPPRDAFGNAQFKLALGTAEDVVNVSLRDTPDTEVRIVTDGRASNEEAVASVSIYAEVEQTVSLALGAAIGKVHLGPGGIAGKANLSGKGQAAWVTGARIAAIQLDDVTVTTWTGPRSKRSKNL